MMLVTWIDGRMEGTYGWEMVGAWTGSEAIFCPISAYGVTGV